MSTITIKPTDYAQQAAILAYMKRKKVDFEVSEPEKYPFLPPVTLSNEEMERVEKSIASGVRTDIENLQAYLKSQYAS